MPKKFTALLDKLIEDGRALLDTAFSGMIRDTEKLRRWSNDLILLNNIGGNVLKPWATRIHHNGVLIPERSVQGPVSAMESVKYAVENDLLVSYRDLILAEEFASLYEQACGLRSKDYILAAAVVFRAVIEEKLRELCLSHRCMPDKSRPGIDNLNQALYKCGEISYDKAMMLNVTALAAIGNKAAHNTGEVEKEEVERLQAGTLGLLAKYCD